MSDYMFNLESHLSPEQGAVLAAVTASAADAGVSLFLSGGAMRDMLGGFPIRDLDFTVEGNGVKLAKDVAKKNHAEILSTDEVRKSVELRFPNGVTCEIGTAHTEKYSKTGAKPQVAPATIHDDLRGRDFTVNAIALSLNRASRGLMIDPTNGASDLERRELRTTSNYTLYDDPIRVFRLIRFKARFAFTIEDRTLQQLRNAREAGVEKYLQPKALLAELRHIAGENSPYDILQALDEEGLIKCFCPALTGAKLNAQSFQKIAKAKAMIPFGAAFPTDWYAISMYCMTQLLSAKERAALIANTKMLKADIDPWQKLETKSKKLETSLKSAKLTKASHIYDLLRKAATAASCLFWERIMQFHAALRIALFDDFESNSLRVAARALRSKSAIRNPQSEFVSTPAA